MIGACNAVDEAIAVEYGSVDSKQCQERIVRIMEGGEEAFERRRSIYQSWKQPAS